MSDHIFAAGDRVAFQPRGGRSAPGAYRIVRTLPIGQGGEVQYRIKGDGEGHERIADEDQLRRMRVDTPAGPSQADAALRLWAVSAARQPRAVR